MKFYLAGIALYVLVAVVFLILMDVTIRSKPRPRARDTDGPRSGAGPLWGTTYPPPRPDDLPPGWVRRGNQYFRIDPEADIARVDRRPNVK